jgi:hypothetical protein
MDNRNKLFTVGYVLGIMSFLIGIIGYIITLILTPTYRMWANSISMLLLEPPYGLIARIGLIISNIIAIPYVVSLGVSLKTENANEIIRKIAVGGGIFACVNAILTGAVAGHDPIQSNLHGTFVLFSWIGGAITCTAYSLLMLKNPNFSKFITTSGFIVAGIFIGFLIPFFITNFCSYFPTICYSFGQLVYLILPTWEWVVVLSILYWYGSNSVYMFYKKDILS